MGLLKCYSQLLDLPIPYAVKEIGQKFSSTYMILNGELVYITEALQECVLISGKKGGRPYSNTISEDEVLSLEVWLPKSGVYYKKDSCIPVLIYRRPIRQWRKSFSYGFYTTFFLGGEEFNILDVDVNSWREYWITPNKVIMYFGQPVGYIKNSSTYVCTDPTFVSELTDWMKE